MLQENSSSQRRTDAPPSKKKRDFPTKTNSSLDQRPKWAARNKNIDPQSLRYDRHDFSTTRILPGFTDTNPYPQRCSPLPMPTTFQQTSFAISIGVARACGTGHRKNHAVLNGVLSVDPKSALLILTEDSTDFAAFQNWDVPMYPQKNSKLRILAFIRVGNQFSKQVSQAKPKKTTTPSHLAT